MGSANGAQENCERVAPNMKIVSGGQTGGDRAALDAAMEDGCEIGGWCPEGRLAEDGPIPDRYPLKELPGGGYKQRTLQNVIDSDGTLVISFGAPTGGTRLTAAYCKNERKPMLLVDAAKQIPSEAASDVSKFLAQHSIQILNVAGPRASGAPQAYAYTQALVTLILGERESPAGLPRARAKPPR